MDYIIETGGIIAINKEDFRLLNDEMSFNYEEYNFDHPDDVIFDKHNNIIKDFLIYIEGKVEPSMHTIETILSKFRKDEDMNIIIGINKNKELQNNYRIYLSTKNNKQKSLYFEILFWSKVIFNIIMIIRKIFVIIDGEDN